jgi:hypothetical protein
MDIRPQGWKRFLLIPLFASLAGSLAITVPLLPELKGKAVGGFFIYFAFGLILTFPLSLVGIVLGDLLTPRRGVIRAIMFTFVAALVGGTVLVVHASYEGMVAGALTGLMASGARRKDPAQRPQ